MTKRTSKSANTAGSKQSRQTQYLKRMLGMHPMWQAGQMLALRRKALGIKSVGKSPAQDTANATELADLRQRTKEQINRLQTEFWSMPLDQLKRKLESVAIDRCPEFKPVVVRLRTAAACRGQFPALAQAKSMDMKLFHAFKSAVVLPPAEAGFHRERFLQSIGDRKRLKQVKKAVNMIRNEHELLYELESDWFETILALKKPRTTQNAPGHYTSTGGSGVELGWAFWFFALVAVRVVLRILMSSG